MVGFSVCTVSPLTITAISVDRLLAVHLHLRYPTLVTKSRVKYILAVIWLISFIVSGFNLSPLYSPSDPHLPDNFPLLLHQNLSDCPPSSVSDTGSRAFYNNNFICTRSVQSKNNKGDDAHGVELRKSVLNTFVFYIALFICCRYCKTDAMQENGRELGEEDM